MTPTQKGFGLNNVFFYALKKKDTWSDKKQSSNRDFLTVYEFIYNFFHCPFFIFIVKDGFNRSMASIGLKGG